MPRNYGNRKCKKKTPGQGGFLCVTRIHPDQAERLGHLIAGIQVITIPSTIATRTIGPIVHKILLRARLCHGYCEAIFLWPLPALPRRSRFLRKGASTRWVCCLHRLP
jgi:hypothetical protein